MEEVLHTVEKQSWEIKISPWSFVTLTLNENELSHLALSLQTKLAQAPGFFQNTPIILSFDDECEPVEMSQVDEIINLFERYNLKILAFYGTSVWAQDLADFFKVPLLKKRVSTHEKQRSLVIDRPLRAGQQTYFEGDIICLAPIHSGAEVIAQGNIHCYASARGRLIAGVNGDKSAKIFTKVGTAELMSIAGIYMTTSQHPPIENKEVNYCYYLIKNDRLTFNYCNK